MAQSDGDHERLILNTLRAHRNITMEGLLSALPALSWNRVFQAVDDLSRGGRIAVRRRGFEYELSLPAGSSQPSALRA